MGSILHVFRYTGLLLAGLILILSSDWLSRQDGHPDYWAIPQHIMNTYCFIMGTFTLPRHFAGERGTDLIHPGVGEYNKARTPAHAALQSALNLS